VFFAILFPFVLGRFKLLLLPGLAFTLRLQVDYLNAFPLLCKAGEGVLLRAYTQTVFLDQNGLHQQTLRGGSVVKQIIRQAK
jgi:hypothetical protein